MNPLKTSIMKCVYLKCKKWRSILIVYIKFKVATPLGDYNPDWAVVVEDTQKLYLVRETKSTLDRDKRRESENKKVDCGKAHFNALGVNFKDAATIYEVLQA